MARTIQIRNVPNDVHRALRTQAAEAGKSLSDYLLEQSRRSPPVRSTPTIIRRAAGRSRGSGVSREEIVAAVRSGRDRYSGLLVVDTSAIVTLLVEDPPVPLLAARLTGHRLHAPHLIDVEFLHALRRWQLWDGFRRRRSRSSEPISAV